MKIRTLHARLHALAYVSSITLLTAGALGTAGCASEQDAPSTTKPAPSSEPAITEAPKGNPAGTGETTSAKIDNATGGTVTLSNGTKVDVPAGALPPGVQTITMASSTTGAPTEYSAASPVFVFGPDGTVFLKPLRISIPVTLLAGQSPSEMTILWSRASGDGFDMIPTQLTPVAGSATELVAVGEVMHFSRGFCGLKYKADPHPSVDPYAK